MSPIKLLCYFDYNCTTGFGTVSSNIKKYWKDQMGDKLQITIIAINYFGEDYTEEDGTVVRSAKMNDPEQHPFGSYFLLTSLKDDYDVVFLMQDVGVVTPLVKLLQEIQTYKKQKNQKVFKTIFYFPVDFQLQPEHLKGMTFFDHLYTYTQYGVNVCVAAAPHLKDRIKVVPHGTNHNDFYQMDERSPSFTSLKFRKEFFGANADKFIICNINRNQPRKDIPTTIFGFMEYKMEYNKQAFLYLHMNPYDPKGWNLKEVLSQSSLKEGIDYMFMPEEYWEKGVPVSMLNQIYNSSDVYLTTATGGGWELTVTEALKCGLPVIMPRHTSFEEIGNNIANCLFLDELVPTVDMQDNYIRARCNQFEISEQLDKLYKLKTSNHPVEKSTLAEMIHTGIAYSHNLTWGNAANIFLDNIKQSVK